MACLLTFNRANSHICNVIKTFNVLDTVLLIYIEPLVATVEVIQNLIWGIGVARPVITVSVTTFYL